MHLGLREIGLLDVEGEVIEFRTLGLGKSAELGAAIGIELHGAVFCPVHDHRGNLVGIEDSAKAKVSESYRYTAFGEREIYDKSGLQCGKSCVGNPWGFASKRSDVETGFVYFSRRYYAPQHGRWTTPDPLGFADGPNPYAYVHNNPMTRFDLYGLWDAEDVETAHTNVMLYAAAEFTARGVVGVAGAGWELTNRSFGAAKGMPIGHFYDQGSRAF